MAYVTAEEALQTIQSDQRVFIHGSACTPVYLLQKLAEQAPRLRNVELVSISLYGDVELDKPQYHPHFHFNSLFVSGSIRQAVNEGRADYVPVFLSEIPDLFKRGILPLDVAIVQVSPPGPDGRFSLGTGTSSGAGTVDPDGGSEASSTLPRPVAWAIRRSPTAETSFIGWGDSAIARYTFSMPSRRASCTVSSVTSTTCCISGRAIVTRSRLPPYAWATCHSRSPRP